MIAVWHCGHCMDLAWLLLPCVAMGHKSAQCETMECVSCLKAHVVRGEFVLHYYCLCLFISQSPLA